MHKTKTTTISILAIGLLASSTVGAVAQDGPAYFTGSIGTATETHVDGSYTDGQPDLIRGAGDLDRTIETSDTRVSGTLSVAVNSDWWDVVARESFFVTSDLWNIENDGGTWSGPATAVAYLPDWEAFDDNDPETWSAAEMAVLTGEGGYEGLTAIVHMVPNYDGTYAVAGAVFPGEVPPVPEAIPTAESAATE